MIVFHNLTKPELEMLDQADTYEKWRSAVNKVLLAREGNYPPDWNERVIQNPSDTISPPSNLLDDAAGF